jgi:DNA-binding NtrC family response regulator
VSRSLLIVDDEPIIRRTLRYQFEQLRYEVHEATTAGEGIESAAQVSPDVVLLDVRLPDMDGLDALVKLREIAPGSVVIVMTAHGDVEMAVEAVRNRGAFWFFQKPVDTNMLELQVKQALDHAHALRKGSLSEAPGNQPLQDLGECEAMKEVDRLISVLAASPDTTVLLLGESGTGKGLAAEILHRRSTRRMAPFQEINCAGLSETFLESELFGAERGAYTDAKSLKRGLLEVADGGTVFLDEIGDLAPTLQPKLLKVLEAKRFRRLGGIKDLEVDVRIITATNRELKKMVDEGRFREDLYYRLNVMAIKLPPLRDRGRDVLVLAQRFVSMFNRTLGRSVEGFTNEASERLLQHGWPGNVRELKNVVERAMILCTGDRIAVEHLPQDLAPRAVPPSTAVMAGSLPPADGPLPSLEDMERGYITEVLRRLSQNRSRTAEVLGISRSTLIEKIKKYGLGAVDAGPVA